MKSSAPRPPISRAAGKTQDFGGDLETLALQALTFLAADRERLGDFLAVTGITADSLRDVTGQPGFATGILTYVAGSEELLIDFAQNLGRRPEDLGAALARLQGNLWWDGS
jgi:Protein of unknown function (DUF3572)